MAHVTITKDLTEVKSKVVFGLTRRQLVFFVLAALVAAPTYFLTRDSLGNAVSYTHLDVYKRQSSQSRRLLIRPLFRSATISSFKCSSVSGVLICSLFSVRHSR